MMFFKEGSAEKGGHEIRLVLTFESSAASLSILASVESSLFTCGVCEIVGLLHGSVEL